MSTPAGPLGAGRTPVRRWVLPVCLVALALVLAVAGALLTRGGDPEPSSPPPPAASPSASAAGSGSKPDSESDGAADGASPTEGVVATPVSLSIPSIDVASDLVRLGLEKDRTVQVPQDADQAGWYELGPAPGQRGSAVILGHVDSMEGPAVFHRLGDLLPGATIAVAMSDGDTELFEVTSIETVPNADFPAAEVYRSTGRPALTLVTCGGAYDKDRGGYQSNVIVRTQRLGATEPADTTG